jgi:1-acyl-sn-glycerol-3-phosphate acyltransferase
MPPQMPELKPRTWSQKFWYFLVHDILRWRIYGEIPSAPKYVAIVAPHTSNWDFFILFMASRAIDLSFPNFAAKHTVFKGPIGWMLEKVGGIPIDRTQRHNIVQQLVDAYNSRDRMILGITPEGTRRKSEYWRSGFYHIAQGACVPLALIWMDYPTKIAGIMPVPLPTGDVEADMAALRAFYSGCQGRHPELQSEARLRPADQRPADTGKGQSEQPALVESPKAHPSPLAK